MWIFASSNLIGEDSSLEVEVPGGSLHPSMVGMAHHAGCNKDDQFNRIPLDLKIRFPARSIPHPIAETRQPFARQIIIPSYPRFVPVYPHGGGSFKMSPSFWDALGMTVS